jgi:hypothetical protein
MLVAQLDGCGRLLGLGLAGIGGLAIFVALCRCIIRVEPGKVLLVSERNRGQVRAWLPGYPLSPPRLYEQMGTLVTWPKDDERLLEHVILRAGTPISLKLAYTGTHPIPPHTARLPRQGGSTAQVAADNLLIRNLLLADRYPEIWQRVSGNALDSAVREFFGTVRLEQVCDPVGLATLPPGVLRAQLNHYLATHMQPQLGYNVQVHTIEVTAGIDQEALALRRRMSELLGVITQIAPWAPDQILLANELLKDLTGRGTTTRVAIDLGGMFGVQKSAVAPAATQEQPRRPPTPPLPPWEIDPNRKAA